MRNTTLLTKRPAYQKLVEKAQNVLALSDMLNSKRIKDFVIQNANWRYHYACTHVDHDLLDCFQALVDETELNEHLHDVMRGVYVNVGEKRAVLHHKTRNQTFNEYTEQWERIKRFVKRVHQADLKSAQNRRFQHVLVIGIGGSHLGVEAMYHAFKSFCVATRSHIAMRLHFIANIDPLDLQMALKNIDFDETLFVVISKSGSTQEVHENMLALQEYAASNGIKQDQLVEQMVTVTCRHSPLDNPRMFSQRFYMDDAIGGRYSLTSAVGALPLALCFGSRLFDSFLKGAFNMDQAALNTKVRENSALLDACIGITQRHVQKCSAHAIIPYTSALQRFPAHLQQLIAESNGKSVTAYNQPLDYDTAPVIFGEPGTLAQHSFFQQLHQGTDVIPVQFIAFLSTSIQYPKAQHAQDALLANMRAQMMALAMGKHDHNPNKCFQGNRPSTALIADCLSPEALGGLLAFYENKVLFEAYLLGINAFDQEGVQLGKVLCQKFLEKKDLNPLEEAFANLGKSGSFAKGTV